MKWLLSKMNKWRNTSRNLKKKDNNSKNIRLISWLNLKMKEELCKGKWKEVLVVKIYRKKKKIFKIWSKSLRNRKKISKERIRIIKSLLKNTKNKIKTLKVKLINWKMNFHWTEDKTIKLKTTILNKNQ